MFHEDVAEKLSLTVKNEFTEHQGPVNCILWLADFGKMVSGGNDKTLRLWDPKEGCESEKIVTTESAIATIIRHSYDSIVSWHISGKIIKWKLPNLESMKETESGDVFGNDELLPLIMEYFEMYNREENFRKISRPVLKLICKYVTESGETKEIETLKDREDEDSEERSSYVIFLKTNHTEKKHSLSAHMRSFSDGSIGGSIRCCRWTPNDEMLTEAFGHRGIINCIISYKPNKEEEIGISGGDDGRIVFWDLNKMKNVNKEEGFVSNFFYGNESILNSKSCGIFCDKRTYIECPSPITSLLDWDNNKKCFFSGDRDGSVTCYHIESKKEVFRLGNIHDSDVLWMEWISKRQFVTCSMDGSCKIIEIQMEGQLARKDMLDRIDYLLLNFEKFDGLKFHILGEGRTKISFSVDRFLLVN